MMTGLENAGKLRLVLKKMDAGVFMPILQRGFMVTCRTETSIEDLLREDFGITGEYMEQRLSTVFLDGQCIDDIDTAIVHSGAVLALSSAMPGLVGATLRRKGVLAAMRDSITHHEKTVHEAAAAREGLITIKLFNVLAGELGPAFLARGIYLKAADMAVFFRQRGKSFFSNVNEVLLDGRHIDGKRIADELARDADRPIMLALGKAPSFRKAPSPPAPG